MNNCKTCEEIKCWCKGNKLKKIYVKACLFTYNKNQKPTKTIIGSSYELNYCPTCGRKIEK